MRAVSRQAYGPPHVLDVVEVARPVPEEDEVLVRIHATALNASDWEILRGKPLYGRFSGLFTPRIQILGSDIAGTVEAVGSSVTRFGPGDAVYGDIFDRCGGFAEWVCVPEGMLRLKPESMSFEQAAAIPQSGVIALHGIRERGQLRSGQTVLINGAGGGGGTFAIQIAKGLDAHVTAVDSAEKLDLMRALGADHVVDYAREDITRSGRRYDLILDLVGGHSLFEFVGVLAPTGRYLMVGGPMKLLLEVLCLGPLLSLFTRKTVRLLAIKVNQGLDVIEDLFRSGTLVPVIDQCYSLTETKVALQHLGDGRAKGKLVIVPGTPQPPINSADAP